MGLARNPAVQLSVVVVAALALGRVVYGSRDAVVDGFQSVGLASFVLAMIAFIAGVVTAGMSWRAVLVGLGERAPIVPTLRVFTVSQLGKYLPGSVWVAMMSIELGHRSGLRRAATGIAVVVASAIGVIAGLAIGLPALPTAVRSTEGVPWAFLLLGVPLLGVLWPSALNRLLAAGMQRAGRRPLDRPLAAEAIGRAAGWALLSYVIQGLHLVVIADAVADGSVDPAVLVSGFALAWTAGFLFLPAPAGAGVRELVLIGVLSTQVDADTALAVAVVSRAVTVCADVVLSTTSAGGLLFSRRRLEAERSA